MNCCKITKNPDVWVLDIGVKIIVGTIHALSLQMFGGYAHLITTGCLLTTDNLSLTNHYFVQTR